MVVEMAMMFAMMVTKKGQMMCRALSCFLSECQPLIVMAMTHRMYGGAEDQLDPEMIALDLPVIARVVVRLKLSPATTIGKKLVTEAAIYKSDTLQ